MSITIADVATDMGEAAARLLLNEIDEVPAADGAVVIPTDLIIRRTAIAR